MNKDYVQIFVCFLIAACACVVLAGDFDLGTNEYTAFGVILIAVAAVQTYTGKILPLGGHPIERNDEPKRFWATNAVQVVVGVGFVAWSFLKA